MLRRNDFQGAASSAGVQEETRRSAILAVLVALALIATGIAVAKSKDWTGEQRYEFTTNSVALEPQVLPAGSSPARFEWPVPANATGVSINATVSFTGQAVQGGSAVIRVRIVAPDGTNLPSVTKALTIGSGQTTASLAIEHVANWAEVPRPLKDNRDPSPLVWPGPLQVFITVDRPADLPVASYAFTADVMAAVAVFTSS